MNRADIAALLCESEPFGILGSEQIEFLVDCARVHQYDKGTVIFEPGEVGDFLYVVAQGLIRTSLVGPGGNIIEIARSSRPYVFGQLAVLDAGPRAARVEALRPTVLVSIARADVLALVATYPVALDGLFRAMGYLVRRSAALAGDLAFKDAKARVSGRLLQLAGDLNSPDDLTRNKRVTQTELAEMVGTSRQTVNHLLQELEADGAVEVVVDGVRIVSVPALLAAVNKRD